MDAAKKSAQSALNWGGPLGLDHEAVAMGVNREANYIGVSVLGFDTIDRMTKPGDFRDELLSFCPIPVTVYPSFVSRMIARGCEATVLLTVTASGKKTLIDALRSPIVAMHFCANANVDLFNHVLRSVPELIKWRDHRGNSLAHYRVRTMKASKTLADQLCGLDLDWMMEANAKGLSPRDFFEHPKVGSAEKSVMAHLDKLMIKKSIRQDDVVVSKIRARKPEGKRRM